MSAAPDQLTVGDYTLLARIGEGGMGVVHLARRSDGERVALKVLRPHIVGDEEARNRLAREVSSLQRVRSRWIAEIVDADPWASVPFVATRYVPGLSLHDEVVAEGPIGGRDLVWLATCLAEGLTAVHAAGVLHRDVKPSNVLMEGRTPILIDFGLARVADDPRLTHTGWLLGTPGYLAPEILYGDDATTASDVHSWGATVAYAATGSPPFGRGPSMAIMDRVRRGEHDLSGVPDHLRGLLAAALDPEPGRRPRLEDILGWLRPQVQGPAPTPPSRARPSGPPPTLTMPMAAAVRSVTPVAVTPVTSLTQLDPTRVEWATEPVPPVSPGPPARVPFLERGRRALLPGLGFVVVAAAAAAYPWPTLALVLVGVWWLRAGSLAASTVGDRRRVRGPRWHDGPRLLVGAPWDLVRSLPATVVLEVFGVGLAIAAGLICYAVQASPALTLAVGGAVLAVSLWTGPGASRVRSPAARVMVPLARTPQSWLVAVVLMLAVGGLLGLHAAGRGTSWFPGHGRPLTGIGAAGATPGWRDPAAVPLARMTR